MNKNELMNMSKAQLVERLADLNNQVYQINERLRNMDKAVSINADKPFHKMSCNEMDQLLHVNEKAYNWLKDNMDKTISDYNLQAYSEEDKVKLA